MKLWDAYLAFKNTLIRKKWDAEKSIVPAFTFQGTTYYMYENEINIPPERWFWSLYFMKESQMNCDRDFLEWHVKAVKAVFTEKKNINLVDIMKLTNHLDERLKMGFIPDLVYKLASVMWFDKSESLYTYDEDYNRKKIEKWKEAGLDFFLQKPISGLIPFEAISPGDLQTYMTTFKQINKIHLTTLWEKLSMGKSKKDLMNLSQLRARVESA